ncbi:MAG: hypothetical protein A2X84_01790 [Desulfuromonadaceae bacterium GWC2_58_13]|nr:MAG: hypothetical protein A2X84_01790 [Desulfuromonadaceae bacterium GWC2_58_13]
MLRLLIIALVSMPLAFSVGCSREMVGGAALGVGAAGAVYEYSNKEKLKDLENDYESGKINRDEYDRRKKEIEDKSLLY